MESDYQNEEWLTVVATGSTAPTHSAGQLVQGVGNIGFPLLEVVVSDTVSLSVGDQLYIGPGTWDRVARVRGRLAYQMLTPRAKDMLATTIAEIIRNDEERFIEYFNITTLEGLTGHPLELLPGLDDDCRETIIAERTNGPFADFADLKDRVECLQQPHDFLITRVMFELQACDGKYHLLTQ
jgi:putative nucleotide binding protein